MSHQSLSKFVDQQVKIIKRPFHMDAKLSQLLDDDGSNLSRSQLSKALTNVNLKLQAYYHQYYSKQAVQQICDQIYQLWDDDNEEKLQSLETMKNLIIPNDLNSDYKIHSIRDVIDQIETLPDLSEDVDSDNEEVDETIVEYNEKKNELQNKIIRLNKLNHQIDKVRTYNELIESKIGDRANIQKNIMSSRIDGNDELHQEFVKMKIIMQKFNNLDPQKKQKLQQLLKSGI